jgi:hypothetical protein
MSVPLWRRGVIELPHIANLFLAPENFESSLTFGVSVEECYQRATASIFEPNANHTHSPHGLTRHDSSLVDSSLLDVFII